MAISVPVTGSVASDIADIKRDLSGGVPIIILGGGVIGIMGETSPCIMRLRKGSERMNGRAGGVGSYRSATSILQRSSNAVRSELGAAAAGWRSPHGPTLSE